MWPTTTTDPNSISTTDMTNTVTNITVAAAQTETTHYPEYQSPYWTTWYGYYKFVPDLKAIIDAKANWIMGKGYRLDYVPSAIWKHKWPEAPAEVEQPVKVFFDTVDDDADVIQERVLNLPELSIGEQAFAVDAVDFGTNRPGKGDYFNWHVSP